MGRAAKEDVKSGIQAARKQLSSERCEAAAKKQAGSGERQGLGRRNGNRNGSEKGRMRTRYDLCINQDGARGDRPAQARNQVSALLMIGGSVDRTGRGGMRPLIMKEVVQPHLGR